MSSRMLMNCVKTPVCMSLRPCKGLLPLLSCKPSQQHLQNTRLSTSCGLLTNNQPQSYAQFKHHLTNRLASGKVLSPFHRSLSPTLCSCYVSPVSGTNPSLSVVRHGSTGATDKGGLGSSEANKGQEEKGDLVYVGTMARLVRFVKLFSITTSIVGISVQPLIYNQVADLHWALALMVGGAASFFVFVTPVLLHFVTKRYVTSMYWHADSGRFRATTYSFLLRQIEHSFTAEQVTVPTTPHLFTTVLVSQDDTGKKTPLFIDPNLFVNRRALIHLLKYNEPLDWELPPPASQTDQVQDTGGKQSERVAVGEKSKD